MSAIIKRQRVTNDAPATQRHAEKSIRVIKSDGEVFAVELSCSCGDVSVIELVHADADKAPNTTTAPRQ